MCRTVGWLIDPAEKRAQRQWLTRDCVRNVIQCEEVVSPVGFVRRFIRDLPSIMEPKAPCLGSEEQDGRTRIASESRGIVGKSVCNATDA